MGKECFFKCEPELLILILNLFKSNIHVWDLRKNYTLFKGDPVPKFRISHGSLSTRNGVTSLCLNPGKTLLFVASMDDVIYEYNVAAYDDNPGRYLTQATLKKKTIH